MSCSSVLRCPAQESHCNPPGLVDLCYNLQVMHVSVLVRYVVLRGMQIGL